MSNDKYLYAIVGGGSEQDLIGSIHKAEEEMPAQYEVISVSHDILPQPDGPWLWTALITAKNTSSME